VKSTVPSRGILTLAYGHQRFIEQARSLAHSLQTNAPHLPRTLVTDSNDPEIRRQFTSIVLYRPEYGSGVHQKMFLDRYSPYDQTLFIDSDCLVLGNLDAFWSAFEGQYFGVAGFRYLRKGSTDPYLDVDFILDKLSVTAIPKFNGGAYYFSRSPEATDFFNTARNIWDNAGSLRIQEFNRDKGFRRDGPNDEAVYGVAMSIHGVAPTWMGSGGMWTPFGYKGHLHLDAIAGSCSFEKEGMQLSPEIVHFPGEYVFAFPYIRERARLRARIEGQRTSMFSLAAPFALSILWQCSRRSSALARLARTSVRAYRAARRHAHTRVLNRSHNTAEAVHE
jgi:hypothetical protein